MAKKAVRNGKWSPLTVILLVVLCLYVLSLVGIFFWAIITAFKGHSRMEFVINNYYKFPQFGWKEQFSEVFKNLTMPSKDGSGKPFGFWTILGNTFLYALGCAFFKTLVPCITAYACARFHFKSSKIVHTVILITMIVPIVGSLPSELKIARSLGFHDSIWGLWLMAANMQGLYFFVMYSAFKAMPMGYSEAARIDGANLFQVMVKIAVPLIKNLFLTIFLIHFVEYWNNYQVPQVYLPNHPTLGWTLYYYTMVYKMKPLDTLPKQISLAVIIVTPILLLFLIFQKKLMGNLTLGGLKG